MFEHRLSAQYKQCILTFFSFHSCAPTEEEVIDLHKRLEEQAEVWLDSQKEIQISQIMGACHHYEAKIHGWERKCKKMVEKVSEIYLKHSTVLPR